MNVLERKKKKLKFRSFRVSQFQSFYVRSRRTYVLKIFFVNSRHGIFRYDKYISKLRLDIRNESEEFLAFEKVFIDFAVPNFIIIYIFVYQNH